jgi:hypothetical protein
MKFTKKPIALTLLAGLSSIGSVSAVQADDDFYEALTSGKVGFSARARFEEVKNEGKDDIDQTSLRTTLSYETGAFHGFKGFIEFEDVTDIGDNDTIDPEDTSVTQAYLQYTAADTTAKFGRQHITYRGAPFHRFVGTVLWRQNFQTFDAITVSNTSLKDTKLSYAYIDKREFVNLRKDEMDTHLFNVQYTGLSFGKLEGYGYLIEFDDLAKLSAKTFGLRLSGGKPVSDDAKVIYTAEYATQDDYGNSTMTSSQDYVLGELGVKYKGWLAKFSYELQEGNGTDSFKTPLGTNHAFQGWADKFLVTPATGLEDMYFTVAGKVMGAKVVGVYHDFEADEGGADLGEEFDLLLVKKFAKHYTVGAKYADYQAGDSGFDTQRFWLWGQVKF